MRRTLITKGLQKNHIETVRSVETKMGWPHSHGWWLRFWRDISVAGVPREACSLNPMPGTPAIIPELGKGTGITSGCEKHGVSVLQGEKGAHQRHKYPLKGQTHKISFTGTHPRLWKRKRQSRLESHEARLEFVALRRELEEQPPEEFPEKSSSPTLQTPSSWEEHSPPYDISHMECNSPTLWTPHWPTLRSLWPAE